MISYYNVSFLLGLFITNVSWGSCIDTARAEVVTASAVSLIEVSDKTNIETLEKELIRSDFISSEGVKQFLTAIASSGLTQEQIAEALSVSRATVNNVLNGVDSPIVKRNLISYYQRFPDSPLSRLKDIWEAIELPADISVEELLMNAKKYIILPAPLADRNKIKDYLADQVGANKNKFKLIADAIMIDDDKLEAFLKYGDCDSFRHVYSCLKSYYCRIDADVVPLSTLIRHYDESRFMSQLHKHLTTLSAIFVPRSYDQIKSE